MSTNHLTSENAAMRAYLQRTEVRLSTMHRVAGVFLNGAGLLFLFPVFLKDAFLHILTFTFSNGVWGLILAPIPLCILGVTLWAYYLLIRDIVNFYFTANHAGLSEVYSHPRFILSGVAFSEYETDSLKADIMGREQSRPMRQFVVPEDSESFRYFNDVYTQIKDDVDTDSRITSIPSGTNPQDIHRTKLLVTAFRLAGVADRPLSGEVAKMELSLVRHAIALRHLVLRYAKALLLFILTTLILLLLSEVIKMSSSNLPSDIVTKWRCFGLAFGLAAWAFFVPLVVRRPIDWIYRLAGPGLRIKNDPQLVQFERRVITISKWIFVYVSVWSFILLAEPVRHLINTIKEHTFIDPIEYFTIKENRTLLLWQILAGIVGATVAGFIYVFYWRAKTEKILMSEPASPTTSGSPKVSTQAGDGEASRPGGMPTTSAPPTNFEENSLHMFLREGMIKAFDESEIKTICFDLNIDYDMLSGDRKSEKIISLITYFQKRDQLNVLIAYLEKKHADVFKLS